VRITLKSECNSYVKGEITLGLYTVRGKLISKASNDEDGAVTFEPVTLNTEGEYRYIIKEPQRGGEQYEARVTVTEKSGRLKAEIAYLCRVPRFYAPKPVQPKPLYCYPPNPNKK
jgi:hypothetical protein